MLSQATTAARRALPSFVKTCGKWPTTAEGKVGHSYARAQLLSTSSHLTSTSAHLRRRRKKPAFLDPVTFQPSAEEAVNNILYNTPSTTASPITRHVLNCLVSDEPGVLSHVSGILAGRGFNIESLVVAKTEVADLSRMTIVLNGQKVVIDQAKKQLEDMVPVWAVLDYTHGRIVEREMLLAKVSTVPHEHMNEFSQHEVEVPAGDALEQPPSMSPLLGTAIQRQAVTELARLFGARVVDVSIDGVILELSAKPHRVDAFLKLLKPFGLIEVARSGAMAMPRSPVDGIFEEDDVAEAEDESGQVDATMLPPG
ncbi:acetolactate synthase [Powellomyces hirtus]|uniref:Acetolactate synthase n=1 Tax=Powellomyces hirtus TaxID=109895 RepID=A0A507E799_9FUNG|nr:acetolactate synthase [Powellomyces hirtus]